MFRHRRRQCSYEHNQVAACACPRPRAIRMLREPSAAPGERGRARDACSDDSQPSTYKLRFGSRHWISYILRRLLNGSVSRWTYVGVD